MAQEVPGTLQMTHSADRPQQPRPVAQHPHLKRTVHPNVYRGIADTCILPRCIRPPCLSLLATPTPSYTLCTTRQHTGEPSLILEHNRTNDTCADVMLLTLHGMHLHIALHRSLGLLLLPTPSLYILTQPQLQPPLSSLM
jgi:hypothetical protein